MREGCETLSVGIADEYSFDVAMSDEFECAVLSLDPTVELPSTLDTAGRVKFQKLGLGRRDDLTATLPVGTLSTVMNLHNKSKFDLIKIDCEGCELPALHEALLGNRDLLQDAQIVLELHVSTTLGMNSSRSLKLLAEIYEELVLGKGYYLFHKSFNNGYPWDQNVYHPLLQMGWLSNTCCYELGFIPPKKAAELANYEQNRPIDSFNYLVGWIFNITYDHDLGKADSPSECRLKCSDFFKEGKMCTSFLWKVDYPVHVQLDEERGRCYGSSAAKLDALRKDVSSIVGFLIEKFDNPWFANSAASLSIYPHSSDLVFVRNHPSIFASRSKQSIKSALILYSEKSRSDTSGIFSRNIRYFCSRNYARLFEEVLIFSSVGLPDLECVREAGRRVSVFSSNITSMEMLLLHRRTLSSYDFVVVQKLSALVYSGFDGDLLSDIHELNSAYAYRLQNHVQVLSVPESTALWGLVNAHASAQVKLPTSSVIKLAPFESAHLQFPVLDVAVEVYNTQKFYSAWDVSHASELVKKAAAITDVHNIQFLILEALFAHNETHHLCRLGLVSKEGQHSLPWTCIDSLLDENGDQMCPGEPELDPLTDECIQTLLIDERSDVGADVHNVDINTPHYGKHSMGEGREMN